MQEHNKLRFRVVLEKKLDFCKKPDLKQKNNLTVCTYQKLCVLMKEITNEDYVGLWTLQQH